MATCVFGKFCMTTYVLWHTLYGNRGLWQALYDNICIVAHSIWQEGSSSSSVWQHLSCGTLYMATWVFGMLCMTTEYLWHTLYGNRGLVEHSILEQGSCGTHYMATGVFGKLCMTTDVLWHILYGNKGLWQALYDNRCLVAHTIWQQGSLASSV